MKGSLLGAEGRRVEAFRHEAVLYDGHEGFLDALLPWVIEGVEAGERVLVATDQPKIDRMRGQLDGQALSVRFVDIRGVGRNPARIIPVWRSFVEDAGDRPVRGIGEPVWAGRSAQELVECHLHETLLNLVFADSTNFWLVCPYDTGSLSADDLEQMTRTHPSVVASGRTAASGAYTGLTLVAETWERALPTPPSDADVFPFAGGSLSPVRHFVGERAGRAGLTSERTDAFVLAVDEAATNSLLHGGGDGTLRVWRGDGSMICEVMDAGVFRRPMAGRIAPGMAEGTGRGLWIANQLCDLVQIRSSDAGTTVRLHMRLD